jgi:hypothetical protein
MYAIRGSLATPNIANFSSSDGTFGCILASRNAVLTAADPNSESRESREDRVRKDLTRRLGHACENLSRVDFEALVTQMTREQLRGERKPAPHAHKC